MRRLMSVFAINSASRVVHSVEVDQGTHFGLDGSFLASGAPKTICGRVEASRLRVATLGDRQDPRNRYCALCP